VLKNVIIFIRNNRPANEKNNISRSYKVRYVISNNHAELISYINFLQYYEKRLAVFSLNLHAVLLFISLAKLNLPQILCRITIYLFISNSTDNFNRREKKSLTQE
jgi:hypothetical protein